MSVYFNLKNLLPKSGTFLPGHPVYIYISHSCLPYYERWTHWTSVKYAKKKTWRFSLSIGVRTTVIRWVVYLLRAFKMFHGLMKYFTSALEGGKGSASGPGCTLPPGKTRYPLYRRLGGSQGRSGQVRKISPPTGIRSPDRPTRRQSLYRLRYPAHWMNCI
jgi:hypothetical protein